MNIQPYQDYSFNRIYNMLFCDDIAIYRTNNMNEQEYPWSILFSSDPSEAELLKIASDPEMETRVQLLAYKLLHIDSKKFLGVIIEVGMKDGLDTLAAYKDGTARYISHAEKLIVWDIVTPESKQLIDELFYHSFQVVKNIGPWDKERLPQPKVGEIRLSFLVADGIYFGNGPFEVLEKDPMASPVINSATKLLLFLTSQQQLS